jgi:hypothetical protein
MDQACMSVRRRALCLNDGEPVRRGEERVAQAGVGSVQKFVVGDRRELSARSRARVVQLYNLNDERCERRH